MRTSRRGVFVALTSACFCLLGVLGSSAGAGAGGDPGSSGPSGSSHPSPERSPDRSEHCTLEIVGVNDDGSFATGPLECDDGAALGTARLATAGLAASSTIAVHFDGFGFTGATLSISGSTCSGGWLNLPPAWQDRIASTLSGCAVRHYSGPNIMGALNTTFAPGGNLTTVAFDAESTRYL